MNAPYRRLVVLHNIGTTALDKITDKVKLCRDRKPYLQDLVLFTRIKALGLLSRLIQKVDPVEHAE